MEKIFARASTMATSSRQRLSERLMSPQDFLQLTADECIRANRYHRPLSVALVQVDGLNMLRKADGETVAGTVLADTVARLIHSMRGPDRTGRLGPGQVGILLPETTLNQANKALERLRETIADTWIETGAGKRKVTISCGLAGLSARMRDPKTFLMTACFELRRAQNIGENTICSADPDLAMMTVNRSGKVH